MARAPGARLGSALRVLTADSHAAFLRDEMKTVDAPAWRRLYTQGKNRAGQLNLVQRRKAALKQGPECGRATARTNIYGCIASLSAWFCFLRCDGKGAKGDSRCGSTQTKASGTPRHDSDLALKGEQGREIVELCFGHCE